MTLRVGETSAMGKFHAGPEIPLLLNRASTYAAPRVTAPARLSEASAIGTSHHESYPRNAVVIIGLHRHHRSTRLLLRIRQSRAQLIIGTCGDRISAQTRRISSEISSNNISGKPLFAITVLRAKPSTACTPSSTPQYLKTQRIYQTARY